MAPGTRHISANPPLLSALVAILACLTPTNGALVRPKLPRMRLGRPPISLWPKRRVENRKWSSEDSSDHPFLSKYPKGLLANCTEHFITQHLDHYNFETPKLHTRSRFQAFGSRVPKSTFQQRYFVCGGASWKPNGTIFFYTGNEADVELYVNNTGLMWENAERFQALMVFAEHRYFGKSLPFGGKKDLEARHLQFLSPDQALADYAVLIHSIKNEWNSHASPVIGFGGSYGGMLCTWFRTKFPQFVDGCIAASAPIVSFEGQIPAVNPNFFAEGETYDCKKEGGLPNDWCADNFRKAWDVIFNLAKTPQGRRNLQEAFHLCDTPGASSGGSDIVSWISSALGYMAMGSYPFPSAYMLNGEGELPAFPLRLGCKTYLSKPFHGEKSMELLENVRELVGIFYNYSGNSVECFDTTAGANNETKMDDDLWNYLYCTEIFQPFGQLGGDDDMFWTSPWNATAAAEGCFEQYGVYPRKEWAATNYGAYDIAKSVTNIVFSNGELDPWRGGGIQTTLSDTLHAIIIPDVGHHVDLFFSNKMDTEAIKQARDFEREQIQKWIVEKRSSYGQ